MSEEFKKCEEVLKEMIGKEGFSVLMDSEYCVSYKENHKNCTGCDSEIGCRMYVGMLIVSTERTLYQDKSFDDALRANRTLAVRYEQILKSEGQEGVE